MNFVIILVILIAFLLLAFPLHHLLASLSELRKGRNPLGNQLLLIGSILATLSIFLYFFATLSIFCYFFLPICRTIYLADWLWFDLLRSLLE